MEVLVEDDLLTIKGHTESTRDEKNGYLVRERRAGTFTRTVRLPDTVDSEKAESSYHNGVLTVSFPKTEAKKARHLKVAVR